MKLEFEPYHQHKKKIPNKQFPLSSNWLNEDQEDYFSKNYYMENLIGVNWRLTP